MSSSDIFFIVVAAVAIILFIILRLSTKNYKKSIEADEFIKANKQVASIYVIDKKFEKPTEQLLGKQIYSQLTSSAKRHKICMVKAKIGPQILTLITDKSVYDVISVKKTVKVELSGLFIVSVVGVNLSDKKKKTWREKITLFGKGETK